MEDLPAGKRSCGAEIEVKHWEYMRNRQLPFKAFFG
jgi:hypothetical protein